MGTPSDGKTYPPDEYCERCNEILIGENELKAKLCEDCQ